MAFRGSRLEPDSHVVTLFSMGLVGVLAVASFTLSFVGLIQVAGRAGIPEQLRWLVPIVVDSTILVYAVAASVQRARGESTRISWVAVGFFTLVSVLANAAHVLAPQGEFTRLNGPVLFGAFLAAIMPISLFFATETTVQLAVAPPVGSVAQRRRRALQKLVREQADGDGAAVHPGANGPLRGPERTTSGGPHGPLDGPDGPLMDHRHGPRGPLNGPPVDHPYGPPRTRAELDPEKIRELASEGLSQRAIAQQLGVSKTSVARVLSGAADETSRSPQPAHG